MNILIQSIKFDADQKLLSFVDTKIKKLERFDDAITTAEVFLKLDKDHEHGNKVVTITLSVPGDQLVAERRSHTFEEATDAAVDALKKQIEKIKHKID